MNKLKMKAKAGVTLVELLVVILIVTILSVSMLPLLKPFVVEAQYAAEAIPVIANLRTKIGVYQYDKGKLPTVWGGTQYPETGTPQIETWVPCSGTGTSLSPVSDLASWGTVDLFGQAVLDLPSDATYTAPNALYERNETDVKIGHFGNLCDINYQELKGKRSRPCDYQYVVMKNGSDYVYFLGCFGDGNGLPKGTGYAVCEIVLKGHKYVGTWKRYKPVSDPSDTTGEDQMLFFTTDATAVDASDTKSTLGCSIPQKSVIDAATSDEGNLSIIQNMVDVGWEF